MASSSSSASQQQQVTHNNNSSSGSEADPQQVMDTRKRKRMQSNRESARRSRLRKQKHLDDLAVQVNELKAQNNKILSTTTGTTQLYLDVEAENSVLRAQLAELSNRLQSLNDIINCISVSSNNINNNNVILRTTTSSECDDQESFGSFDLDFDDGFSMNSWGFSFANYPTVPTQDIFMC
ncbi:bZIP transcription factor 11-like [Chenopodium quinoa]|uniref:BZIP domain-containing protein n=1 Tax=Chenopodium quinoa TaxID=63459 RepID=A0A803L6X4_CHEQI|nr:bZIP transcription factor 11-like [Chenopodium quinoa]